MKSAIKYIVLVILISLPAMAFPGFTQPGGRITLTSGSPVMNVDATAQSTVYYAPYVSPYVPLYNGIETIMQGFIASNTDTVGLSLALDSNSGDTGYQQSGKNYDLFVGVNSGTLALCTGPAWTSDSARGTGAGTTEIQLYNGIWTNKNSMTCRFGNSSGNTFTCAANQCTLVGSMRATANGQTSFKCNPIPAIGGTSSVIGISNAYNQIPVSCYETDSTNIWTYTTAAFRPANNSTANSIAHIDALAQSPNAFTYTVSASNNTAGGISYIANSHANSTTSNAFQSFMAAPTNTTSNNWQQLFVNTSFPPALGYNIYYPLEYCYGGTCSYGDFGSGMNFTLNTTY
jgi:hypothetical protein